MNKVRPSPCEACPYRKDVPSGVWKQNEYDKLRDYDKPFIEQPTAVFACHAAPGSICHGWACVHADGFAMRLRRDIEIPEPALPLFESGTTAAEHGEKDIRRPKAKARRMIDRLLKKHKRLRKNL